MNATGNFEIGEQRRDGLAGHRCSSIGMHDVRDSVHSKDVGHHLRGEQSGLVGLDVRPDDVAGEDVDHRIGVEVGAFDRAGNFVMSHVYTCRWSGHED